MNDTFMKEKPVLPLILSMSLPMVLSMLVNSLYNIVDSMFVAQLSENALTAVSLAFPAQNLMIAVAVGTGVGINALLSKSLGEKNFDAANKAAVNSLRAQQESVQGIRANSPRTSDAKDIILLLSRAPLSPKRCQSAH